MHLSDDRKALYEELVVWLSIRMSSVTLELPPERCHPCEDGVHTKGCVVGHGFASAFQAACCVLLRLGIVVPLDGKLQPMADPSRGYGYCRILFDVPEIRERLRESLPEAAPKLSIVLLVFLQVAMEFHNMPTPRGAFAPPQGFESIFELLVACGYAERIGREVRWTRRVAPQMRAIYAWTSDGVSIEEQRERDVEKMWRTLPTKVRDVFFSGGPVDVVSLTMVIDTFWVDREWRYIDNLGRARAATSWRPDSLSSARDLVKRYEKSRA